MRFQYTELDNAKLSQGEQEETERQIKTLTHAEDIKTGLYTAFNCLSDETVGALDQLRKGIDELEKIANLCDGLDELTTRLNSAYIELKDIAGEIETRTDNISYDPQLLQSLTERIDLIYSLERKFHTDTVEELIKKRDDLLSELDGIENGTERLQELKKKMDDTHRQCVAEADKLTKARKEAAALVEREMKARLAPLGIPNVKFAIKFERKALSPMGADSVSFLFNANGSESLQPISQVASGGEIARIMLSLKAMISGAVKLPTIIFDEIDTGVSGRIAEKMARIMREMGNNNRQVISITHQPQIAALGNVHYKVSKTDSPRGTVSHMRQLNEDERTIELAQMLSGSDVSEAAMENARALLRNGSETAKQTCQDTPHTVGNTQN